MNYIVMSEEYTSGASATMGFDNMAVYTFDPPIEVDSDDLTVMSAMVRMAKDERVFDRQLKPQ